MDMRPPPYAEFRFAFYAQDFDASLRFYQEQLGLLLLSDWDRPDGRGALLNAAFGAVVEIFDAQRGAPFEARRAYVEAGINLAVRVESPAAVDAAHERLKAGGVKIEAAPADQVWGHRTLIVRDPDGIAVHIYAELKPRQVDAPGVVR